MNQSSETFSTIEHCWIEMPDGVRLAARIWLPICASSDPVPAVFEYIPYRKVDMVRARDERNHPYLAENGMASIRVDMRGSGDSEGYMSDMYSRDELDDARHVIEWLARQTWCNGKVGMFGTSWGGTAGLQASIDAPDALKATIAVCATHDRYEDDIHHMGGCVLTDSVEWGATLPTILGAPQSVNVGEDCFAQWKERLDALAFPLEAWLRNEDRGEYWRHGSVIHEADRLSVPILCVGGWADRYSNSVMSLVDRRPDLAWGIVGPWGHHYPDQGHPGPGIGFQKLMLDWWRHWLVSETPPTPKWPKLRTWIREFDQPADAIELRSGRWVQSNVPRECTEPDYWHLTEEGLIKNQSEVYREVTCDLHVGGAGADTGYFGRFGGLPPDQRDDDELSICFDTVPLEEDHVIYGSVELELELEAEDPRQQLCLRLNDVAPDGTSARITWAIRNLALDDELDAPKSQTVTGLKSIKVRFPSMAYRLKAGHTLRLAVSQSYWPMVWPSPVMRKVKLLKGCLILPIPNQELEPLAVSLPEIEDLPEVKSYTVTNNARLERYPVKLGNGEIQSGWHQPYMSVHYDEIDTTFGYETRAEFRMHPDDPLTATCTYEHMMMFERPDGTATITCKVRLSCDASAYHATGEFSAKWNGQAVKAEEWNFEIGRLYG